MYGVRILIQPDFKPSDPAPGGYLEWHEWAGVQWEAGLRQQQCCKCGKWRFPQELSGKIVVSHPRDMRGGVVRMERPVCVGCAEKSP